MAAAGSAPATGRDTSRSPGRLWSGVAWESRQAGVNACSIRAHLGRLRTCPTSSSLRPFQPTGDQPAGDRQAGRRPGPRPEAPGPAGRHRQRQDATRFRQVIARANRPTLVLAHNKTLAAQLYSEFREFFPDNAVEYFVSYFDYYQPEAYLPRSDTYIEKDSSRNDEIDKLRHAATRALFERRDVIIVASRVVHLRPGRAGGLRRDGRSAAGRRALPARRRAAPAGRPAVPAQRRRPVARPLPRSRRHARAPAGVRRRSSASSSSATRSSGSPRSTR